MSNSSDKYLVVGNPIAHSRSPDIHNLFAKQTSQNMQYASREIPVGHFSEAIAELRQKGIKGINVTVPFKADAYDICTRLTDRAQITGSVNTISITTNDYIGDTTDGRGLINDLKSNHQVALENKTILIIGAGGAVAGVVPDFLAIDNVKLHIANRTVSKAENLAVRFKSLGNISVSSIEEIPEHKYDVVVNATSASLSNMTLNLSDSCINFETVAYDMVYSSEPTPFLKWTNSKGARLNLDGLGMLVEQAAVSFEIWRGIKPNTTQVIETVRKKLSGK